jgi:biopolymer transport protein ExbB
MRLGGALTAAWILVAAGAVHAQDAPEAAGAERAAEPAETEESPSPAADESVEPAAPPPPPPDAKSLDELLDLVEKGFSREREENRLRVERFRQAKDEQERLLAQALATAARQEARSERLEVTFNENERALAELQENLDERLGTMGELFGVVRQVAGDMASYAWESVTSSQLGNREEILERLGRSRELPTTEDLGKLWYELHREMTEQGKVVRFRTTVLTTKGKEERRDVIRAGIFSVVSGGLYLHWDPEIQKIRELNRQPPSRYLQTVSAYEESTNGGFARLAVDPSRGSLLAALIDTPSRVERIQQGGAVGYTIIVIGLFALAVGITKWASLSIVSRKVEAQRNQKEADPGNPLGRVLRVYEANPDADSEALELKLDQAVIFEAERLERFMWLVRVVSVVAPLLGLLGTVTGMIQTFQAITLFGAGDPKMMAGGISEALVTTMLGLITAAPLVLLYAFLSTSRRRIVSVLNGQSAGLVAMRVEQADA